MHIEKMDWKSRRDLARTTTNNIEDLILLSSDNSVRVRKEILRRKEVPIKVLANMYKNSTKKRKIITILQFLILYICGFQAGQLLRYFPSIKTLWFCGSVKN